MRLMIETSSLNLFDVRCKEIQQQLQEFPNLESTKIVEDPVGYGILPTELVLAIIFIFDGIGKGISYDVFKFFIQSMKEKILNTNKAINKLPNTRGFIYIEDNANQKRFKLEIDSNRETIEVKLPDGTHLVIK
jgi:hypothetical protein